MEAKKAFYNCGSFAWVHQLEQHVDDLLKELNHIISLPADYKPGQNWLAAHPSYVKNGHDAIKWRTFELLFFGIKQPMHIHLCPNTWNTINRIVPELVTAQFSILEPHTHVQPHKGFTTMVLRAHLPLIVPKDGKMGIRVGSETRIWEPGRMLIFDDSMEHEAWNYTDQPRAVLMFDFARPDGPYSADQICRYKLERTDDPFLLGIAPATQWVQWYEQGEFPAIS